MYIHVRNTKIIKCFANLGTNNIKLIMRHYHRPDLLQFLVELVGVNVRVTTMYQRMAPSQSDASVSTLLMNIQKWYLTSAQRAARVRSSRVPTLVVVDSQLMLIRLVQSGVSIKISDKVS